MTRSEITFPSKVHPWGNSLCITLPKAYAAALGLEPDDDVDVTIRLVERKKDRTGQMHGCPVREGFWYGSTKGWAGRPTDPALVSKEVIGSTT